MQNTEFDIIIIGSGAAGLSAGIITANSGVSTLILEKSQIGGELVITDNIEPYPGFPDGISGFSLVKRMEKQFHNYRGKIIYGKVTEIATTDAQKLIFTEKNTYFGNAIILATGTVPANLDFDVDEKFFKNGIYDSAMMYGHEIENKKIAIYGNTTKAAHEALYLAKIADSIILINKEPTQQISHRLKQKIKQIPNIQRLNNHKINQIFGKENIESIVLENMNTGETRQIHIEAIFNAIQRIPNSGLVKDACELNSDLSIIIDDKNETNLDGIFAAGSVCNPTSESLIETIFSGEKVGLSAIEYIVSNQ